MNTRQVSRRYARALYALIQEGAKLEAGLHALAEACRVEGAGDLLASPTVKPEAKVKLLQPIIADGPEELGRLVRLLAERNKLLLLPEIVDMVDEMVRAARAEAVAEVTVATELKPEVERKIATALAGALGKRVSLNVRRDPEILGGLIVRVGDRQIDYSLRTRLDAMKQAIAGQ